MVTFVESPLFTKQVHDYLTEAGQIWLLLIYAKSAVDSIPGHILKAIKEEMEHATK